MTAPLSVRRFRGDDLHAAIEIFQRAVHEVAARDYTPEEIGAWAPEPPDAAFWRDRLASGNVWICEADGRVAGFARVEADGYVDLVFVHPDLRRRGVASALFEAILAWADANDVRCLFTESSRSARAFFEAKGFRLVRRQHVERHGVELENFVMERASGHG